MHSSCLKGHRDGRGCVCRRGEGADSPPGSSASPTRTEDRRKRTSLGSPQAAQSPTGTRGTVFFFFLMATGGEWRSAGSGGVWGGRAACGTRRCPYLGANSPEIQGWQGDTYLIVWFRESLFILPSRADILCQVPNAHLQDPLAAEEQQQQKAGPGRDCMTCISAPRRSDSIDRSHHFCPKNHSPPYWTPLSRARPTSSGTPRTSRWRRW